LPFSLWEKGWDEGNILKLMTLQYGALFRFIN
jgi:hypothetical protein